MNQILKFRKVGDEKGKESTTNKMPSVNEGREKECHFSEEGTCPEWLHKKAGMDLRGEMVYKPWVWELHLEGEIGEREMKKTELPKPTGPVSNDLKSRYLSLLTTKSLSNSI